MRLGGRRTRSSVDYWPGFVDALSTLLIVIIFLVLVFVLAQFYLGQALSGRDQALAKLNEQVAQLADLLALEKATAEDLRRSIGQLTADLQAANQARDEAVGRVAGLLAERDGLQSRLGSADQALAEAKAAAAEAGRVAEESSRALNTLRQRASELEVQVNVAESRLAESQRDLAQRDIRLAEAQARGETLRTEAARDRALSTEAQRQVDLLNQQVAELRAQLTRIQALLDASEAKSKEQETQIVDLGRRLNLALASKVEELNRYRSEFFGRLRAVLGERQDIRIVGDRFVFQSEVLFAAGSADLGDGGKQQLQRLAGTLKDLLPRIPDDLNWVLRVDGHTDRTPIRTAQFPSNWELSTARATAVVKFLIDQGIPPERLAATGFGEFHPLETDEDETSRRRNRRIELKLTER